MGQPYDPSSYLVGVDIGTSFSAAAFADSAGVRAVSLGEEGTSIPSVMALDEDGRWVFGRGADHRGRSHPGLVVRDFKRRLGDSTPFVVGDSTITAAACVASMYDQMVRRAVEQRGKAPVGIAATHPANWGRFKLERFTQELSLATAPPALLVSEPLAVARAFFSERQFADGPERDRQLVVYDLGGGTFDVAIVRATSDGIEMVGRPGGVERLGGIDIDAALWHRVLSELEIDPVVVSAEIEPDVVAALARLRADLVEAKHLLSIEDDVTIAVFLPSGIRRVRLDRVEFDRLVSPIVDRSIEHLAETIERNGLAIDEIDLVVLAGGSSSIPLIARRVSDQIGVETGSVTDPQTAAARGAAMHLQDTSLAASESATHVPEPHVSGNAPARVAFGDLEREPFDSSSTASARSSGRKAIYSAGVVLVAGIAVAVAVLLRRSPTSTTSASTAAANGSSVASALVGSEAFDIIESGPTTAGAFGDNGQSFRFPSSGPLEPFSMAWEYPTPLAVWNSIAVNDGVIYALSTDRDSRLSAIDVETGRELWSLTSPFVRSPITWEDRVVMVSSSAQIRTAGRTAGDQTSTVVLEDGNVFEWIDAIEVLDGVGYYSVSADDYDAPTRTFVVTARELTGGEVVWEHPVVSTDGGAVSEMAVTNSLAVVSQETQVVALDRLSGVERWRFSSTGAIAHVATTEGSVVVSSRRADRRTFDLSAIDTLTGETRFGVVSALMIPAIIGGDLVFVPVDEESDQLPELVGVDLDSGLESWTALRPFAESPTVAMVEGPDLFYVVSDGGSVTALTIGSAAESPSVVFSSQLEGSASAATHFHLTNGFLVELDRGVGKLRVYR